MEQTVTFSLARSDAEALVGTLRRRAERLCDIRRELCEPEEGDELERQERAFFEAENAVVERVLAVLDGALSASSQTSGRRISPRASGHFASSRRSTTARSAATCGKPRSAKPRGEDDVAHRLRAAMAVEQIAVEPARMSVRGRRRWFGEQARALQGLREKGHASAPLSRCAV